MICVQLELFTRDVMSPWLSHDGLHRILQVTVLRDRARRLQTSLDTEKQALFLARHYVDASMVLHPDAGTVQARVEAEELRQSASGGAAGNEDQEGTLRELEARKFEFMHHK